MLTLCVWASVCVHMCAIYMHINIQCSVVLSMGKLHQWVRLPHCSSWSLSDITQQEGISWLSAFLLTSMDFLCMPCGGGRANQRGRLLISAWDCSVSEGSVLLCPPAAYPNSHLHPEEDSCHHPQPRPCSLLSAPRRMVCSRINVYVSLPLSREDVQGERCCDSPSQPSLQVSPPCGTPESENGLGQKGP